MTINEIYFCLLNFCARVVLNSLKILIIYHRFFWVFCLNNQIICKYQVFFFIPIAFTFFLTLWWLGLPIQCWIKVVIIEPLSCSDLKRNAFFNFQSNAIFDRGFFLHQSKGNSPYSSFAMEFYQLFPTNIEIIISYFYPNLLMEWTIFIDFLMWSKLIPKINPNWTLCVICLMYCRILFW